MEGNEYEKGVGVYLERAKEEGCEVLLAGMKEKQWMLEEDSDKKRKKYFNLQAHRTLY